MPQARTGHFLARQSRARLEWHGGVPALGGHSTIIVPSSELIGGPLPPFEVAWTSRDKFLATVRELLEVYPELKPLIRSSTNIGVSP